MGGGGAGLREIKAYLASQQIWSFGLSELDKIINFEGHSFDCANCIDFFSVELIRSTGTGLPPRIHTNTRYDTGTDTNTWLKVLTETNMSLDTHPDTNIVTDPCLEILTDTDTDRSIFTDTYTCKSN